MFVLFLFFRLGWKGDLLVVGGNNALLCDTGLLAGEAAKVVQLGATDAAMTDDLELGDLGAVKREGTLNTDTEGNLADGA